MTVTKLSFEPVIIKMNQFGIVVMYCNVCKYTIYDEVHGKSMEQLNGVTLLHINARHVDHS